MIVPLPHQIPLTAPHPKEKEEVEYTEAIWRDSIFQESWAICSGKLKV